MTGSLARKYNIRRGLRSLTDLTEHLKARADDNHAAPVTNPAELTPVSLQGAIRMSSLGKVTRLLTN